MTYQIAVPIAPDGAPGESFGTVLLKRNAEYKREVAKFQNIVAETGEFAIDTETTGLLWYKNNCVMIQVFAYNPATGEYSNLCFPFYWGSDLLYENFGWLKRAIRRSRLLMWNAKFDMHFLAESIGADFEDVEIVDGLVLAQMLGRDRFPKADLKTRAREDLGYDMADFTDSFTLGKTKTLLHYDLHEVATYAVKDPIATYWECKHLLAQLETPDGAKMRRVFHQIEKPLTNALYEMECRGMVIDTERVEELYEEYSARLTAAAAQIHTAAGRPFNIQSTAQFCDILQENGFPKEKFRTTAKSNKRKLDEKAVELYIGIASKKKLSTCLVMLAAKQEYGTLQKLISTYIIPLRAEPTKVYDTNSKTDKEGRIKFKITEPLTKRCADGFYRVFPSFNQTKAQTGRMSCDVPNAQNWPRPNKKDPTNMGRIRQCVIAPRGYTLGDLDYSQIELRVLGHCSKEPRFINAYRKGLDLHRIQVAKMLKKKPEDVTDEERNMGKATTSFGVIYGMHPSTLAREHLNGDVELANRVVNEFFAVNGFVHKFKLRTEDFAIQNGYVETMLGRRRYLPGATDADPYIVSSALRQAVNTVIQGGAADLVKIAMLACHKSKRLKELGIYMLAQVHDELIFMVSLRAVDELGDDGVIAEIKKVMEDFPVSRKLRCPLVAEGGLASNWYEAH